jgi:hypothetical protein
MNYFFLAVFIPKSGYAGQKRKMPVANGTTPIQPHAPITPLKDKELINFLP